jgi:hypothetical protein
VSKVNVEELVGAYVNIRAARDELKQGYEVKDEALKSEMGQIEAMLLTVCNDVGADSIKTQHGTAIRSLKERYYSTDWDNFKQFVIEQNAVDLLERRIHQGNFKEYLSEHVDDGLPPGVNVMREYGISVRKSNK